MAEMRELVTVEQAERLIVTLAIALPPAGLALGAIIGSLRRRLIGDGLMGLLVGLAGPAIWAMWKLYNRIMGHYGLDSVRGLLINLALFVSVGVLVGLAIGLASRRLAVRRQKQKAS
jgi:hypothetical protein